MLPIAEEKALRCELPMGIKMTKRPTTKPKTNLEHRVQKATRAISGQSLRQKVDAQLARQEQPVPQAVAPREPLPQLSSLEAPERTPFAGVDRAFRANLARLTQGVTRAGIARAYFDWLTHLMLPPRKQLQLVEKAGRKATRLAMYAANVAADPKTPPCMDPLPQDRRLADEAWRGWPQNLIYQSFLLNQQW